MAEKVLIPTKGELNKITPYAFETATTVSDGFKFQMPDVTEEYVVIVVQNAGDSAADITLKMPENGSYAASASDEIFNLDAGAFAQIRIESARFASNTGVVKLVSSSADVKVAVLY